MKVLEKTSTQSKIIYLFIFSLAGLFLAGTIVSIINELLSGQLMETAWGLRISSVIQMFFMFFMPAITLIIWSDNKPLTFLGVKKLNGGLSLSLLAFLILMIAMPFISLVAQLNQLFVLPDWMSGVEHWMRELEDSALKSTDLLLSGDALIDYIGNILFVGIIAAVAEEVFFRGVMQQLLVKMFKNKHAGVWLAAVIFSIMHLQFYGFIPRMILGALLGYLFVWSENLWIPIWIHFLNNALVITFSFFLKDNSLYQSLENLPITLSYIAVGFLSLGLMIYLLWEFRAKTYKKVDPKAQIHDYN